MQRKKRLFIFHVPCIDQMHKTFKNTKKCTLGQYFILLKILHENCSDMISKPNDYLKYKKIFACKEAKLMHYLSSIYPVTKPLHLSELLAAPYQELAMRNVTIGTCCTS
jgi:hypothetical protein